MAVWIQFWTLIVSIVACCVVIGSAIVKVTLYLARLDRKASVAYDTAVALREELQGDEQPTPPPSPGHKEDVPTLWIGGRGSN